MDFWNVSNNRTAEIRTTELRSASIRLRKKQFKKLREFNTEPGTEFNTEPGTESGTTSVKCRSLNPDSQQRLNRRSKHLSIASQLTNPLSLRLSGKLIAVTLSMTFISSSLAQAPTQQRSTAAQESTTSQSAQTTKTKSVEPAMLSDIMQIRQQLGGGLQSTFSDQAFQQMGLESQSGFASALERVASAEPTNSLPPAENTIPENTIPDPSGFSNAQGTNILPPAGQIVADWNTEPGSPLPSQPPSNSISNGPAPTKTAVRIAQAIPEATVYSESEKKGIRAVARKLDALAADLEDLEQFNFADDLRSKATDLRDSARSPFVAESSTEKTIMR